MKKINPSNYITAKFRRLSLLRIQDGFVSFTEDHSDKYDQLKGEVTSDKSNSRINAFELFSLFTADIIKEKVLFIR